MAEYQDVLAEKKKVEKELLQRPGVHSVAIGYKRKGGVKTDELAIVVFTSKKKVRDWLKPEEIIPESYNGVPTDIVELPEFQPEVEPDQTRYRPAPGGVQLYVPGSYGTLGTFVQSKKAGDNPQDVYILSNYHVLGDAGTKICQAKDGDGNKIAVTARGAYYEKADAAVAKMDDAAVAAAGVIQDVGYVGGVHEVTAADLEKNVKKRGRTTRFTRGIIRYINMTVSNELENKLDDQIAVYSLTVDQPFTESGDSGSVVMMDTKANLIVSLHWGGGKDKATGLKVSASSPIQHVLESVEAEVISR